MSEEETDSNLPENVFLTKLALDILGGRSFDVHGNRQDFEDIVCPQQKAAEDADKIKWKNFIRRMQSMFEIELQRTMKNSANNYNKYMREFREQNPMDGGTYQCPLLVGREMRENQTNSNYMYIFYSRSRSEFILQVGEGDVTEGV